MSKYIHIVLYINFIFAMTGLELANAMKDRPKPIDTQSESSMILTNKKGKKKSLKFDIFANDLLVKTVNLELINIQSKNRDYTSNKNFYALDSINISYQINQNPDFKKKQTSIPDSIFTPP